MTGLLEDVAVGIVNRDVSDSRTNRRKELNSHLEVDCTKSNLSLHHSVAPITGVSIGSQDFRLVLLRPLVSALRIANPYLVR